MRPRLRTLRAERTPERRTRGFGLETFSRIVAIWLFGRATWRIRPRRVVPRGGRASRLDASRYRAGEPPNGGKRFRAYHVLHDHLGGEVFLDGGGRHWRDKGAAFENPREGGVHEKSGQRVIGDSPRLGRLRACEGDARENGLARAFGQQRGVPCARMLECVEGSASGGSAPAGETEILGARKKKWLANSRRVGATEFCLVTRCVLNVFARLFRARG